MYRNLPVLGVGIGWRQDLADDILRHAEYIDWCEVISEHYVNVAEDKFRQVERLAKTLPLSPHGIDLSIGTDAPIEDDYLDGLERLIDAVRAPWFSDHLCFTRVPGMNIGQLTPLPFTKAAVDLVVGKALKVRERIDTPFLLENITNSFLIPRPEMAETEFINAVLEEADIGMLLDVCNVFVNSQNYGYDPYGFIESLPLARVVHVHIAGGTQIGAHWHDSHSQPVQEEVFQLLEFVMAQAPVKGVLLERDSNFPDSFQELLDDLFRAREIFDRYSPRVSAAIA
jgi:uncharacterized protein (UPF0276 family)